MFINIQYTNPDWMNNNERQTTRKPTIPKTVQHHRKPSLQTLRNTIKKNKPARKQLHFRTRLRQPKKRQIIQGILDCFDPLELEKNPRKDLSELAEEIIALEKKISKINSLDYLVLCEVLKQTNELEVTLGKVYTNYLEANLVRFIVEELSKTETVTLANFKKIIEYFVQEKGKHREIIVEAMYILDAKETENRRQITPSIKYQNPDAWIRESTIHTFVNPPESTQP